MAVESALTLDMGTIDPLDPPDIMSPKHDYKGKGKATPQDELPPEALFPHRAKEEAALDSPNARDASPVERSRKWVEEEGEVFRKGQILLGPEEMGDVEEGDGAEVTGDELRIEVCNSMDTFPLSLPSPNSAL